MIQITTRLSAAYRITQNHSMVGVGRDLCGSSSPTPLPKQGHPEQAAQDHVQAGLEYLQRRRLHNLPGQPVPWESLYQELENLSVLKGFFRLVCMEVSCIQTFLSCRCTCRLFCGCRREAKGVGWWRGVKGAL